MNRALAPVIPAPAGIHPAHPCILQILILTKTYPCQRVRPVPPIPKIPILTNLPPRPLSSPHPRPICPSDGSGRCKTILQRRAAPGRGTLAPTGRPRAVARPCPRPRRGTMSGPTPCPLPLPLPLAPAHVRSGAASLPLAPPGQPGPASADRSVLRSTDLWPAHASRPLQAVLPRVPATSRHLDCPPAHHLNRHSHASRSHTPLRGVNPRPPVATGGPPGSYAPATCPANAQTSTARPTRCVTQRVHPAIQVPSRPPPATAGTGGSRQHPSRAPPRAPPAENLPL